MLEEIFAGINLGILALLLVSLILVIKNKKFENKEASGILDMIIVSLIVFGIITLFDLVISLDKLNYLNIKGLNLDLLTTGINIILIPLMLVMFLAIEFSLKDLQE